ncbi:MAG: ABC transporter ATP-binding protein [Acidimicrobiales bacterium]
MSRKRRSRIAPPTVPGGPEEPAGAPTLGIPGPGEQVGMEPVGTGIAWARPVRMVREEEGGGRSKLPAVVATNVVKDYGEVLAVDKVSLKVPRGQKVVVVGPNGSGKTTLIRIVAGLLEATAGEVLIDGAPAGSLEARAAVSYIADDPVLYDDLSVAEHLEYIARLHGTTDGERRSEVLIELLGLSGRADDLPARFSRGLRQKTSVALGLVRPFSLLLVDEPFVGLDAPGRAALLVLLDEVAASGAAVVVATHQLDFVAGADRCVGLQDGRVVYDGESTPAAVQRLVGWRA